MEDSISDLSIFNEISKEKIPELGNFFNLDIFRSDDFDLSQLQEILGVGFKAKVLAEIVSIFYNFTMGKNNQKEIFQIIDTSKLDEVKKKILKETIQKIHDKTDLADIDASMSIQFLQNFGHPHTHDFKTVTEFRPLSNGKEITKIVPLLIVSIDIHDSDVNKVVNFQLTLKQIESLIDELNSGANSLKLEIEQMRNKFGDKVIG